MILKYGDMWTSFNDVDLFLITCNSFIKRNGALVMGKGIARTARDMFNDLDLEFGRHIQHLGDYGVLLHSHYPKNKFGIFQVKRHFINRASLPLIKRATNDLCNMIDALDLGMVSLNYPGIGNGQLSREAVYPIISKLPDNVCVWQFDEKI